jgi:hypothetical protein
VFALDNAIKVSSEMCCLSSTTCTIQFPGALMMFGFFPSGLSADPLAVELCNDPPEYRSSILTSPCQRDDAPPASAIALYTLYRYHLLRRFKAQNKHCDRPL